MSAYFSTTQEVRKVVHETRGGVVAAQHRRAAEIGAGVLADGGDATDAAVAVSFAIGVVEPWMSGPAGGGAMMLWREDEGRALAVNFGMRAPGALNVADYPLTGEGQADDLFPWKAVAGDRNVQGATAVAVPGVVDGIGLAHERFGTMPWAELLQPAVGLAREGMRLDWYSALLIAATARALSRDPAAAAMFLEDGCFAPVAGWTALSAKRLDQSRLADTLDALARGGPREFFEGEVARALAADVAAKGGCLSAEDLAGYRAAIEAPLAVPHRSGRFHVTPTLTAGPTFRDAFAGLAADLAPGGSPDGAAFAAYAGALKGAYRTRLAEMGDVGEHPASPACTTHFSVVDRHGNMAAVTQTLLSIFGARVVSPSTGLLLNNGIMWFDPEPGGPNSLAPGKRCLMNVCPVIGETGDTRFAFGASGGRKIVSTVVQLSSFVADFGMDLAEAFHHPRIDVSGGDTVVADESLPPETLDALAAAHPLVTAPRTVYPYAFGCPAGVMRRAGLNAGCTEPMSPWGDAVAEPARGRQT